MISYYDVSHGIFSAVSAFICGCESGKMTSFPVLLRQTNESGWSDPLIESTQNGVFEYTTVNYF